MPYLQRQYHAWVDNTPIALSGRVLLPIQGGTPALLSLAEVQGIQRAEATGLQRPVKYEKAAIPLPL